MPFEPEQKLAAGEFTPNGDNQSLRTAGSYRVLARKLPDENIVLADLDRTDAILKRLVRALCGRRYRCGLRRGRRNAGGRGGLRPVARLTEAAEHGLPRPRTCRRQFR